MSAMNVKLRRKGVFTLPASLRRKYGFKDNDTFALEDLGNGCFMLVPQFSRVARLGDQVAQVMAEEGVSFEEMLQALDEARQDYGAASEKGRAETDRENSTYV